MLSPKCPNTHSCFIRTRPLGIWKKIPKFPAHNEDTVTSSFADTVSNNVSMTLPHGFLCVALHPEEKKGMVALKGRPKSRTFSRRRQFFLRQVVNFLRCREFFRALSWICLRPFVNLFATSWIFFAPSLEFCFVVVKVCAPSREYIYDSANIFATEICDLCNQVVNFSRKYFVSSLGASHAMHIGAQAYTLY